MTINTVFKINRNVRIGEKHLWEESKTTELIRKVQLHNFELLYTNLYKPLPQWQNVK